MSIFSTSATETTANKEHCEYTRMTFTAYWMDASPSTEDIYVADLRWTLSYANIQAVQAYVLNLLQTNITANQCLGVVLQGYLFLGLDASDRQALGWRVVTGCII